jgi:hypothetical protein
MRRRLVVLEGGVKAKEITIQQMSMQLDRSKSCEEEEVAKQEQVSASTNRTTITTTIQNGCYADFHCALVLMLCHSVLHL